MSNRHEPKFLVDFMLGRLARWLRMLGFDAVYVSEKNRANLILQSLKESRILLTRDHRLSRKRAWKLVLLKDDSFPGQLRQLVDELKLAIVPEHFFTRCSICNAKLEPVAEKSELKGQVPEYVHATQDTFSRCPVCKKIYWLGTHKDLLIKDITRAGIRCVPRPNGTGVK